VKVLIVGGGGREHAIAWKLAQSPKVEKIYCAPGNAGIANLATCLPIAAEDITGIVNTAQEKQIDLAVIGPEMPLALGITDALERAGIRTFGPNRKCARLEASKSFTKAFLERHNIPTACHQAFTDQAELQRSIGLFGFPMVLKADGLAAGKGVVIAETREEAETAIQKMMGEKVFGAAGERVVVEEFLTGTEASILCFVDEKTIVPMESAQDYKRIFDGDKGPNTGGMGTYSPNRVFNSALDKRIRDEILLPTLAGFQKDGLNFKGVLFIGLMISAGGPRVIEFNNRFGDPETQVVLPRLETDLLDIMVAVTENRLSEIEMKWSDRRAACIVLASGGYPDAYQKGFPIEGLENETGEDVIVFHAGTAYEEPARIVTAGGRVLGVTALGDTHEEAREKAYAGVRKISFEGMQYRMDIGK